jgi:L-fucose isomerase-like protein
VYLPLNSFSPEVKLALVSASRNCFPRSLSEQRTEKLLKACKAQGISLFVPKGDCRVIETKEHAVAAAAQAKAAGCDGAVLYLGNFSPEIEDANFVKAFGGPVMVIAAAEEAASTLARDRGDALCGLLSAIMAIKKRGLPDVHIPQDPIVDAKKGAASIGRFARVVAVVKGIRNATVGLFGPRPRDFETCNYNVASLMSIGVEVEELGFFDLENRVRRILKEGTLGDTIASMKKDVKSIPTSGDFHNRLAAYEQALLSFRDSLKLSGATTQCWTEQETSLGHVPCFTNARLASRGFPIACENDVYSLTAELLGQYASNQGVTILDINHSIPADLHRSLAKYPVEDLVGMFHCGNTDPRRMKNPEMKYQVIMNRLMEPKGKEPDITRGTIEGQIAASPITVVQVHGVGDKLQAYLCEGEFLDIDPKTFGATGTAHIPGFRRFYRHVLLGRFHHHAGIAFAHCGGILYDALTMLGAVNIYTPLSDKPRYPGENPFEF